MLDVKVKDSKYMHHLNKLGCSQDSCPPLGLLELILGKFLDCWYLFRDVWLDLLNVVGFVWIVVDLWEVGSPLVYSLKIRCKTLKVMSEDPLGPDI